MADYKKHIGKIIGTAAGNAIIPGVGGALIGGALGSLFDGNDNSEEENKLAEQRFEEWKKIAESLSRYRLQDRKSIMFLSDVNIRLIWHELFPGDCEVIYLPYSYGVPEGITIEDTHVEEGALYVYDPRNDCHYYKASEISQVLIKDKFREIKQVFESLGATQIDITFRAQKDEKNEYNSNNSQNVSGRYGAHKASVSHSGSRGGTSHATDFRQLEIHKKCTGKTSHLNFNNCYWYKNDVILQDEVRSIKAGSTIETNFVDTTKSYCSLTATSMDKLEAEYEYMESIGVSGMAQWDNSTMQEISQELVWDVHVVYSNNKDFTQNDMNNNILEASEREFETWYNNADADDLKPYVYDYDFSEDYDNSDEFQVRWMRIVDQYGAFLSAGARGAQPDYGEAFRLLNITVNVGRRVLGHCNLGEMYELNRGVNLDYPKARELYELVLLWALDNEIEDTPYEQFANERLNVMQEKTNNFSMVIGSVCTPKSGRGIVVYAKVISGVVSIGDDISILTSDGTFHNNLKPTDFLIKLSEDSEDDIKVNSAQEGDTIVMHIEGGNIKVSDVKQNDVVCSKNYDFDNLDDQNIESGDSKEGSAQNQTFSEAEQEYIEEYKCMLEDGEIGPRERKSLERRAQKLGISAKRASELEASIGSSSFTAEEQEYLDEYREILADGEIRDRDRRALDRLAQRNGISASRAKEIEKLA